MKKQLLIIIVSVGLLPSCMMNVNSLDRAVMLEENEAEYVVYGGGNIGGSIATEYNLGLGVGARIGMTDRFTFGGSADLNYNSRKAEWVNNIFYGQVSIDQKFSLVKDIFAFKLKEGIYINNYFGTVATNPTTGLNEFVSQERVIPYVSPSFLISPEGRKVNKNWQLTFGLHSIIGIRAYGHIPWTAGISLLFDYSDKKDKFLTGFELGGGLQTLVKDGEVAYISLGLFFSKFKKTTPLPALD